MSSAKPRNPSPSYAAPLGLAIALTALGGAAYWLEYVKKPKDAVAESNSKRVLPIAGEPISRVEVSGPKISVALDCLSLEEKLCKPEDESRWRMGSPVVTSADDVATNSLLKNFGNLTFSETIDLSQDTPEKRSSLLEEYGLSPQARSEGRTERFTVQTASGKRFSVFFGGNHPISEDRFALLETDSKTDEERVFVVPQWQLSIFSQTDGYLRDKRLFSSLNAPAEKFTLERHGKQRIEGGKNPESGEWKIASGNKKVPADREAVEALLSGATRLVAEDFAAERKDDADGRKTLSGAKRSHTLIIQAGDEKKELRVFEKTSADKTNPDGKTILATSSDLEPVFTLSPSELEKVDRSFADLRPSRLIPLTDRYSFEKASIQSKGAKPFSQSAVKVAGSWRIGDQDIPKNRMETLLDRLTSKTIKDYPVRAPTRSQEFLQLEFSSQEGLTRYSFEIWKRGKSIYARRLSETNASGNEIVELDTAISEALPWDERFFTDEKFGPDAATPVLQPGELRHEPQDHHGHEHHSH